MRGIAVLLMFFLHAGLGRLDAGFLGVNIFFLLSGYPITGLVVSQRARHGRSTNRNGRARTDGHAGMARQSELQVLPHLAGEPPSNRLIEALRPVVLRNRGVGVGSAMRLRRAKSTASQLEKLPNLAAFTSWRSSLLRSR